MHSNFENDPRRWYAVLTRPRAEKPAAAEIASRGIECYLPVIQEVHYWSDRRKIVEMPLFAGYLFVRMCGSAEERLAVLAVGSVARILGTANRMEAVSDCEIESIRRLIASGMEFDRLPALRSGEWVRVRRGPLRGVEGYFERVGKRGRLILNVELLARALRVDIEAADVQTANPRRRAIQGVA